MGGLLHVGEFVAVEQHEAEVGQRARPHGDIGGREVGLEIRGGVQSLGEDEAFAGVLLDRLATHLRRRTRRR